MRDFHSLFRQYGQALIAAVKEDEAAGQYADTDPDVDRAWERVNNLSDRVQHAASVLIDENASLRKERDEWMALAVKYGHHATATLDKRTRVLKGDLMIAADIIAQSKGDAIAGACYTLAQKFYAAAKMPPERAPVPAVD